MVERPVGLKSCHLLLNPTWKYLMDVSEGPFKYA